MSAFSKFFSGDLFGKKDKGPAGGETAEREFSGQYIQHIIAEHGSYLGSGISSHTLRVDFDKLFVDQRLAFAQNPGKVHMNPSGIKELQGKRSVWDFLKNPQLPNGMAVAMLGGPGAGKTTLLQHLLLTMAQGRHDRYGSRGYVPVLIPGPDLVAAALDKSGEPVAGLNAYFSKRYADLNPPSGFLGRLLERGDCLLLVDGLDDVAESQHRKAVVALLDKVIAGCSRSRVIVSSRPQGFRDAPLKQAWVLDIQPFSGEQARRLIESYYQVAEAGEAPPGTSDEALRQRAGKKAADLLHKLRVVPTLSAMTTSPLVLTYITRVHRQGGGLPQNKLELYGKICEALLQGGAKAAKDNVPVQKKMAILRLVASAMMKKRVRDIRLADLVKLMAPHVAAPDAPNADAAAEQFLRTFKASNSLLLEREVGSFRFAHPLLQEYLCAVYLFAKKDGNHRFQDMVGDTWWHEALVLYAAQGDATKVVQACLEHGSAAALALCSECVDEAKQLDPEVKQTAQERLALENPDLEMLIAAMEEGVERRQLENQEKHRRKQAAEVRFARRLRGLQRIDEAREIDPEYITCAEYQLFLDEMRERGYYFQPDHWTSLRFPPEEANMPVIGVRAEDARDYCYWLTMKQGAANFRFRLPRPEEARQYPANNSSYACWCADGEQFQLVGLNPKAENTVREALEKLPMLTLRAALPLERGLNRELDSGFEKDIVRALALQLDPAMDKALNNALHHVRELILNRAFDLGIVISPDLDLARVLSRSRNVSSVSAAVENFDMARAKLALAELKADSEDDEAMLRFAEILGYILDAVHAETVLEVQQAQRRYVAQLAGMVYRDYQTGEAAEIAQRRQQSQAVLEFHGFLQMVIARSAGALPPWEGIRLVREQGEGVYSKNQSLALPTWAYNA